MAPTNGEVTRASTTSRGRSTGSCQSPLSTWPPWRLNPPSSGAIIPPSSKLRSASLSSGLLAPSCQPAASKDRNVRGHRNKPQATTNYAARLQIRRRQSRQREAASWWIALRALKPSQPSLFLWRDQKRSFMSKNSAPAGLRSALSYCVQQVQAHDYVHYLTSLHLPVGLRTAAFTLRAFNVETARILESAREVNLARMRLQWWRDAVDGLYKGKRLEHPVVTALSVVVEEHKLSKLWFSRLIDARQSDLEMEGAPRTMLDVENYSENTASALLCLTLEAAGIRATSADHAASHVGKAEGVALLLKSSPHHSLFRRTYIPIEVAARHGVSQEDIYRKVHSEGLADAVLDIASVADAHLSKARALASTVPPAAIPVLLPAVPAGVLLNSLKRSQFNVFDPKLVRGVNGVSPMWMQLQLKWHAFRNTY